MTSITTKLRACHDLTTPIRVLLQEALDQAKDQGYDPHWTDAILNALNHQDAVAAYIYNTAACLNRRPVPARTRRH